MAPTHRPSSALIGFFTSTGISTPLTASAISCTANGLTVVRAPTQRISTPCLRHSSTCSVLATSVAVGRPVSALTWASHSRPISPMPSNEFGRVRGFQIPARNALTCGDATSPRAVASICSADSALHGPAITHGKWSCGSHLSIG